MHTVRAGFAPNPTKSNTIVARTNEIEAIKKHFDRVLEGGGGVAVITGPPGIGKTFLVEHVANILTP
jgi:Cdc6-like AAA superfamily ATPase